jgi:hypothetical protein
MDVPVESVMVWGALAISAALGLSAQVQLWFTRRALADVRRSNVLEISALRQRIERDRHTIDSDIASYLNLSREEFSDLRGRFEKFKEQVEGDLDDMSADMDVIENSVANCVRASRASPFSSLNVQFLNDGLDDVRARLGALELAAQKARLAAQGAGDDQRPLWLVQRERKLSELVPKKEETAAAPAPAQPASAKPEEAATPQPRQRASFADFLTPSDTVVNADTPAPAVEPEPEPLPWPGSLSRIAAF